MSESHQAWLCQANATPQRLEPVVLVDTERQLEEWAEADPTLLGDGYVVVGRQVQFDGGPADLLVIDPQGRWVIIEIKRSSNDRQDLAQALDYAASLRVEDASSLRSRLLARLAGKPYEVQAREQIESALAEEGEGPREVAIMLVGVGLHPRAERIIGLLAEHQFDVRVANFTAHRSVDGSMVLSREIAESTSDVDEGTATTRETAAMDAVLAKARTFGCEEELQRWVSLAEDAGLYARPYKHSIMLTPPQHHNAYLGVARPLPHGGIRINHGPSAMAQWFPWISAAEVEEALGPAERGMGTTYTGADLQHYLDRLQAFLPRLALVPPEYTAQFDESAPWTTERFTTLFASRPHIQEMASLFLDSVKPAGEVTFGRAAMGQAYLAYQTDGPVVLQLTGRGVLRGMWSMGTLPRDGEGWQPLKDVLHAFGGVSESGGAPGVSLSTMSTEDANTIIAAARQSSSALMATASS